MERWSVFPPFLFLHPKTVSDSDGNNLLLLLFAGFGFGQFMDVHYDKVCDLILRHKESKDSIIRKTVITLIPHMAAYDPQGFCDEHHSGGTTTIMGFSFLTVSMRFLLGQLKKPEKAFGTDFLSPLLPHPPRSSSCLSKSQDVGADSRFFVGTRACSFPEYWSCGGQGWDGDEGLPGRHPHGHSRWSFPTGVRSLPLLLLNDHLSSPS